MMTGFVCRRTGLISDYNNKCLSKLVLNVFNPAIIFSSMTGSFEGSDAGFWAGIFWEAALVFALMIFLSLFCAKLFGRDRIQQNIARLMLVFSNMGFIGIPVIQALFGAEYVIYVAIFILEYNILIYTYGYALLQDGSSFHFSPKDLRPMLNMGTIACVCALVVFTLKIPVPGVLSSAISYLGNAATPLSLIVIGVTLGAQEKILSVFTGRKKYLLSLFRLILFPLAVIFVLKQLPVPETVCRVSAVLSAMPIGTMPLIMLTDKGLDAHFCSDTIIVTTVLSVVTIPLIVWLFPMVPTLV